MNKMLIIYIIYLFLGMVFWWIILFKNEEDITLKDILLTFTFAVIWLPLSIYVLLESFCDKPIIKRRIKK